MTPMDLSAFTAGWQVSLPGLLVAATAMMVMIADLFIRSGDRDALALLGIAGLVGAAASGAAMLWPAGGPVAGFGDTLRGDRYALFFTVLICAGSILTLLMSVDFLREHPLPPGEYYALVLLS